MHPYLRRHILRVTRHRRKKLHVVKHRAAHRVRSAKFHRTLKHRHIAGVPHTSARSHLGHHTHTLRVRKVGHVAKTAKHHRAQVKHPRKSLKGHHISAAAIARRVGRKHPHKGFHGPRAHHHISATAHARRIGRKHPHKGYHGTRRHSTHRLAHRHVVAHHRGHHLSLAARRRISVAMRGHHYGRKKK